MIDMGILPSLIGLYIFILFVQAMKTKFFLPIFMIPFLFS